MREREAAHSGVYFGEGGRESKVEGNTWMGEEHVYSHRNDTFSIALEGTRNYQNRSKQIDAITPRL
ncbi:hypothetical protein RHGRI_011705 [Rhododendron griersonianum]|uniref:Uncharacterized protein n=1 Tax=Rhododendron griersonianum TaxID=479676 RepID=A0AAV6KMW7_9ERIC|nr:hypothetical protein RHGRI_011705 [Rhododendron griersonianum]